MGLYTNPFRNRQKPQEEEKKEEQNLGEQEIIPGFDTIPLTKLHDYCELALNVHDKFVYIVDMSGQSNVFFKHRLNYHLFELHTEVKTVILGKE